MEFGEVVRRRRMIRNYDPDRPVDRSVVDRLLEQALHAPSAGFSQGWRFLVLDEPSAVARYWSATTDPDAAPDRWLTGMRRAPVLILAFSDKSTYLRRYAESDKGWSDQDEARWPVPYWDIDTGMAALLLLLGATDEGLGACFFGVPVERTQAVHAEFDVPAGLTAVGVVSLGHRAPDVRSPSLRRGRRPVAEVTAYNGFG